ncbi:MAG: hypothetical protein JNK67_24560 [Alphaproteobacteria bacterium]|nr:hypothetical protein [Alphaproteobacteria bacterium]
MTMMEDIATRWRAAKPVVVGLAIGVVAGPLLTSTLGWQVTSRTAQEQVRAGVVEQQALFCESRARAEVSEPAKLDWSARSELARKWATLPGAKSAESGVAMECARKLAA